MKNGKDIKVTVRMAFGSVNRDIPASREVLGFLAHTASLGCNKCLKGFTTTSTGTCCSGFERYSWAKQNDQQHRRGTASDFEVHQLRILSIKQDIWKEYTYVHA